MLCKEGNPRMLCNKLWGDHVSLMNNLSRWMLTMHIVYHLIILLYNITKYLCEVSIFMLIRVSLAVR